MDKTLALIKPDMVKRNLIGVALREIEQYFKILDMKMIQFSESKARLFYEEHINKPFFPFLSKYISVDRCVAIILSGKDIINKYRTLIGATNPVEANEGTLRKKFGISLDQNSFHGSDSEISANREIEIIFG